jgi:hypothetical protein
MADYVLGSQAEEMTFDLGSAAYRPAGVSHAVDPARHPEGFALGYAICGAAVRVWPGEHFNPEHSDAHPVCVERLHEDR